MDVRDYAYIVAIAEQGSISRAAARLFITQPALTKFLQRTEQTLGLALFARRGNQFLLTEAGQRYVETGRAIIALDRQFSEYLEQEQSALKNQIRLGFSMGRTNDVLENLLPAFYAKYPDIRVCAMASTSHEQLEAMRSHKLDLALVTNVERLPEFQYLPVERCRLVLAVREDAPLLAEAKEGLPFPSVSKKLLEGLPLVTLSPATNSGSLVKELFHRYEIHPKIRLEVSDVRSLMDAVEQGLGAAVYLSVPVGRRHIRYLCIEGIEPVEQLTELVLPQGKSLSPAMKYMVSLLTGGATHGS